MAIRKTSRKPGRRKPLPKREVDFRPRVANFLRDRYGHEFANQYYGLFSGVFAALTRGWTSQQLQQPIEKVFFQALKAKNIRHVAEVGPGASSMLLQMAGLFQRAGCKLTAIGPVRHPDDYESAGITHIPRYAGKLRKEDRGKFDLVIGHNVFSFGGAPTSLGDGAYSRAIENATNGALDLIQRLDTNRNATIVLTEDSDALLIDRRKIEPHVRVLRWEPWNTQMGHEMRDPAKIRLMIEVGLLTPYEGEVRLEAPNMVILQRKPGPKKRKS